MCVFVGGGGWDPWAMDLAMYVGVWGEGDAGDVGS